MRKGNRPPARTKSYYTPFSKLTSSMAPVRTLGVAFAGLVVMSTLVDITAGQTCQDYVSAVEGDYWTEVGKCGGCLGVSGCGYCLSTLTCLDGTVDGPSDGSPCPNWLTQASGCPVIPSCSVFTTCGDCASANDCAWCSSQNSCMTISDVYR